MWLSSNATCLQVLPKKHPSTPPSLLCSLMGQWDPLPPALDIPTTTIFKQVDHTVLFLGWSAFWKLGKRHAASFLALLFQFGKARQAGTGIRQQLFSTPEKPYRLVHQNHCWISDVCWQVTFCLRIEAMYPSWYGRKSCQITPIMRLSAPCATETWIGEVLYSLRTRIGYFFTFTFPLSNLSGVCNSCMKSGLMSQCSRYQSQTHIRVRERTSPHCISLLQAC